MAANNYERRVENGRTEGNSRSQSPDREYPSLMVIHLMAIRKVGQVKRFNWGNGTATAAPTFSLTSFRNI